MPSIRGKIQPKNGQNDVLGNVFLCSLSLRQDMILSCNLATLIRCLFHDQVSPYSQQGKCQ